MANELGLIRDIGGFTADVTVEEDATDELEITRQPVEQGAQITDHAYKLPAELTCHILWSNSSPNSGGDPTYCQQIYEQLLALQEARELLDVQTGKRLYDNMLIKSIRQITNEDSEYSLNITIRLQQVIVVPVSTSQTGGGNQKNGQQTQGTNDTGTKQLGNGQNYNGNQGDDSGGSGG